MVFDPRRNGHGTWFEYARDMGNLPNDQVAMTHGSLLKQSERVDLSNEALRALQTVFKGGKAGAESLASWTFEPLLRRDGDRLTLARSDPSGQLSEMIAELLEWRLSERAEVDEVPSRFLGKLALWYEYAREEIAPHFGTRFDPGTWNSGIVRLPKDLLLLTTLKKDSLSVGGHYDDSFVSASLFRWQSQTQTRRDSQIGRILSGEDKDTRVHLFVCASKLRNGKAAPFRYCGQPKFVSWEGEKPITVQWALSESVPIHMRNSLEVPEKQDSIALTFSITKTAGRNLSGTLMYSRNR